MTYKYCPKCGAKNGNGKLFCNKCSETFSKEISHELFRPKTKKTQTNKRNNIAIILVIALIVEIMFFVMLPPPTKIEDYKGLSGTLNYQREVRDTAAEFNRTLSFLVIFAGTITLGIYLMKNAKEN